MLKILCPLLTVLFTGLKLTGYIAWSWWAVTAPLWGGFVLAVLLLIFAVGLLAAIERHR